MTQIGVFIPIGSRGWLISTTSPKTYPTFDLNKTVVQRAEHYGLDFALAMIKLRGYDGPSEYWQHNLESFTLMAGLAAVTKKIQLFASVAMLTIGISDRQRVHSACRAILSHPFRLCQFLSFYFANAAFGRHKCFRSKREPQGQGYQ